jgi:hypothetical protein
MGIVDYLMVQLVHFLQFLVVVQEFILVNIEDLTVILYFQ